MVTNSFAVGDKELHWINDDEQILSRLQSKDQAESDYAVLFAETMETSGEKTERLLIGLREYIHKNRFVTDERQVYVCSAIRKYAMNMREEHFESYSTWLSCDEHKAISEEVEAELFKGICWRLTFVPVTIGKDYPSLVSELRGAIFDLCNTRLVLRGYANTVTYCYVTLCLLDCIREGKDKWIVSEAHESVLGVFLKWFYEYVDGYLEECYEHASKNTPEIADYFKLSLNRWKISGGQ